MAVLVKTNLTTLPKCVFYGLMLPESLKIKKVCVEIRLHPLHPFFRR